MKSRATKNKKCSNCSSTRKKIGFVCCKNNQWCKDCIRQSRKFKISCSICTTPIYRKIIKKKYFKKSLFNCSICYNPITKAGILNECKHRFCLECIMQWSKFKNTCPECRVKFQKVFESRHRLSRKFSKTTQKKKRNTHNINTNFNFNLQSEGSPLLIPLSSIFNYAFEPLTFLMSFNLESRGLEHDQLDIF